MIGSPSSRLSGRGVYQLPPFLLHVLQSLNLLPSRFIALPLLQSFFSEAPRRLFEAPWRFSKAPWRLIGGSPDGRRRLVLVPRNSVLYCMLAGFIIRPPGP